MLEMKMQTFADLMSKFGYLDEQPNRVICIEVFRLTEQLRMSWNYGHAVGQREAMDEHHRNEAKEAAESLAAESWVRLGACSPKKKTGGGGA
jgi:hypothetical protein